MDYKYGDTQENKKDDILEQPSEKETDAKEADVKEKQADTDEKAQKFTYTDPNADVRAEQEEKSDSPKGEYTYHSPDVGGHEEKNTYQSNTEYNTRSSINYAQGYASGEDTSVLSTGDWILTLLPTLIPCGFILYLYWAFSSNTNVNRRNFSRAMLIFELAGIALVIIIFILFAGVSFFAFISQAY